MLLQAIADTVRQHDTPILLPLAAPNCNFAPLEIDILDAQLEALLQPQPASV